MAIKYSILVPSYDPEGKNREMFVRLIESIDIHSQGKNYELIIRKNGASYVDSHNDALFSCRGNYIVVLNDDVLIQDNAWLEKLTSDTEIISWKQGVFGITGEDCWDFSCWSMSRSIFEKIGLFDTLFSQGIGIEDNDYVYRAKELGITWRINPIDLIHYGGMVLNVYNKFDTQKRERNKTLFFEKWNKRKTW